MILKKNWHQIMMYLKDIYIFSDIVHETGFQNC